LDNASIADIFDELADLLEFRGENPFRIRAYRGGARAIRNLDEPVSAIVNDPARNLADLSGIGKTLAEKTDELLRTGTLAQLMELRALVPDVVIDMSRIPGLGAKKATRLHDELGIKSLDELRQACNEGRVAAIKGFGNKTEQSILEGLSIAEAANERITWAAGDDLAHSLADHLKACPAISKMEFAGSYRRGRETIGDLDIVIVSDNPPAAMDHFESYVGRTQTIGRGDTKVSIRIGKSFQVDLRVVAPEQFGAAIQYFTGSQAHNIHVRRLAKERGLKINEYGVFKLEDDSRVAGTNEEDVYRAIGLPWIAPELREDRHELEWAAAGTLPELIELSDILGDLHMHTHATDGNASIREMADAAIARGLSYIAITDHSQRVSMANGLTPQRLREQWRMIDEIRPEYTGRLVILKGIECDILEGGGMDLPDDCLAEADWVLASIHYGQKQPRAQITERMLGAIENPYVSCVAHPTGRLINRRPAYDVDVEAVMQAASANGTLLELNANPARLDLNDIHLAAARRLGIPVVISTDAHSTDGMDVMRYGIKQARRGGLSASDVANTRSAESFLKLIR
jgi:DNA polymerase (family X)